jgi:hypothetical protein
MQLDEGNLLSDAQAITASAASTNVFDAGEAGVNLAADDLELFISVETAFNTLTGLTVAFEGCDTSDFSTDTVYTYAASPEVLLTNLVAGYEILRIKVPYTANRYYRTYYTVTGTDPTEGAVTAGFTLARQNAVPFASGLNLAGV